MGLFDGISSLWNGQSAQADSSISSDGYKQKGSDMENTVMNLYKLAQNLAPMPEVKTPGTSDNINGYPEMSDTHKYILLASHYLNGDIPEGEAHIDSPTMKNIIDQYQQAGTKNEMLLKMQSAQPGFQKKHPEFKKEVSI